ncbi:MAG: hypothetical protein ACI9O4_002500, partial [Chitinophagales bacterium]
SPFYGRVQINKIWRAQQVDVALRADVVPADVIK